MTALDIVTAYSVIPGREDVALFLEEAMRGEGWQSSRMAKQRREYSDKLKNNDQRRNEQEVIGRVLSISTRWWKSSEQLDSDCTDDDDVGEECIYVGS